MPVSSDDLERRAAPSAGRAIVSTGSAVTSVTSSMGEGKAERDGNAVAEGTSRRGREKAGHRFFAVGSGSKADASKTNARFRG